MNVTVVMENFQGVLRTCVPFVLCAGIRSGDDEWDEFIECAFHMLVRTPIKRDYGVELPSAYATWNDRAVAPEIQVVVEPGVDVICGSVQRDNSSTAVTYVAVTTAVPLRFSFREIENPISSDLIEKMNYVAGEIVDDGQFAPIGTRVCAPFGRCEFSLVHKPGRDVAS